MARTISVKIGSISDSFTLGVTKPNADNTGVDSNVALTTFSGTKTINSGEVFENREVLGRIVIAAGATNWVIRNCLVWGTATDPTSSMGLIGCTAIGIGNGLIERCTIVPQNPHYFWDGIQGHGFTARRCNIYGTTDGLGLFYNSGTTQSPNWENSLDVAVEGCYIHDHGYRTTPSNVQSDLHTHNDGIQVHGGYNIRIEGNNFYSFTNPAYSDLANPYAGTGSQITGQSSLCQTTVATIDNIQYLRNWFDGGGEANIHFDIKSSRAITNAVCYGNRFGRNQRTISGTKYTIRRRASLIDLDAPTTTGGDNNNVFEDNGSPVTVVTN